MANYRAIAQHHPQVREYIRARKWVHRGETLSYGPNIDVGCLTTDAIGFRQSECLGRKWAVKDCIEQERYGIVTGPSNVYGFGLPGDSDTIPSMLGERFGFPFANVSLPEGHSRNLFAILLNLVTRAPRPPAIVLHLSGGDFTGWAYTGIADPVFGTPNLYQAKAAIKERGGVPQADKTLPTMLSCSQLWHGAIVRLCRSAKVPLVLGNDTTFFEKGKPSDYDRQCGLGEAMGAGQARQFAIQRELGRHYYAMRAKFAEQAGLALVGPGPANEIGFVDEFHYDASGVAALCADFAPAIEEVMKQAG